MVEVQRAYDLGQQAGQVAERPTLVLVSGVTVDLQTVTSGYPPVPCAPNTGMCNPNILCRPRTEGGPSGPCFPTAPCVPSSMEPRRPGPGR